MKHYETPGSWQALSFYIIIIIPAREVTLYSLHGEPSQVTGFEEGPIHFFFFLSLSSRKDKAPKLRLTLLRGEAGHVTTLWTPPQKVLTHPNVK